jgi:uncharacterized protein YbaR (Trm112 family)
MALNENIREGRKRAMKISPELLAILVCPRCKGEIEPVAEGEFLVCRTCRLKYPVVDGIPVMLVEEAKEYGGE